jgi:ATP-dependent Clp protease, protease subunit
MKAASGYPFGRDPREPGEPGHPVPGTPGPPRPPRWPAVPRPGPMPGGPVIAPGRAWTDSGDWQTRLNDRLLEKRVVMAHGHLDDPAATLLCAQLLTVDADSADRDAPIRLHLQNLTADLTAALTVIDALDAVGVPVHAYASGQISGAALGVLAAAGRRIASPNAGFVLSEPETSAEGTAAELAARQRQVEGMLDALYFRLADVTGREVDEIRDDARAGRFLTAAEAVDYGLLQEIAR